MFTRIGRRTGCITGIAVLTLLLWLWFSGVVSYWIATSQYRGLVTSRPESRAELEQKLWYSSTQEIKCSASFSLLLGSELRG